MKNLERWKKKTHRLFALVAGIAIVLSVLAVLLYRLFPDLLGSSSAVVLSIFILLCWLGAFVVLNKIFRKIVIIHAMEQNGVRVHTDRRFFPSRRTDVNLEILKKAFLHGGYDLKEETEHSFCVYKTGFADQLFYVVDGAEDAESFLEQKEKSFFRSTAGRRKRCIAVCFLTSEISSRLEALTKDIIAIERGCIMPIAYDTTCNIAYYMGGDTGTGSVERVIQDAVKKYILDYEGPFPAKTEQDVTPEEQEYDALDLDEIFEQMKSMPSRDKEIVVRMQDGQVMLDGDDGHGVIYYKTGGKGFVQMYLVDDENPKHLHIDSLENLYFCSPKTEKADFKSTMQFKHAVENYLDKQGYTFSYHEELR